MSRDEKETFSNNIVNQVSNFIDNNIRVIRWGCYGVGLVGVIILGRSIHASKKFLTVNEIPSDFIRKHVRLRGRVQQVRPDASLTVDHIPILTFPGKKSVGQLPISLAGTEVEEAGLPWLQEKLPVDQHIWFRLLSSDGENLECIVTAKLSLFRQTCINEELIKQGLATVRHYDSPPTGQTYLKHLDRLIKAETLAEKKGRGIWQKPTMMERLKETRQNAKFQLAERWTDWKNGLWRVANNLKFWQRR